MSEGRRAKRGCWLQIDKPRETRAPLRTASTWRSVSPIPFFPVRVRLGRGTLLARSIRHTRVFFTFSPACKNDPTGSMNTIVTRFVCKCAHACVTSCRERYQTLFELFSDEDPICGSGRPSRRRCILED